MGVPRAIDTALRTLVCAILLPPGLIFASSWVTCLALLGARRSRSDRAYVGFAEFCLRIGGTRVEVDGLERIQPGQGYMIVANHESNWDPLVAIATLRQLPVRFVVKKEIIRIPVFGRALLGTGNIRVVRGNPPGDVQRIQEGMGRRDPDVSILFYAEGTRARDGSFRPFKKGAFATAISAGLPILPVATAGTFPIWTPNSLRIRKGTVTVEVGQPIGTEGLSLEDRDELRRRTEDVVRELRERARRRLRALGFDPGGVD